MGVYFFCIKYIEIKKKKIPQKAYQWSVDVLFVGKEGRAPRKEEDARGAL